MASTAVVSFDFDKYTFSVCDKSVWYDAKVIQTRERTILTYMKLLTYINTHQAKICFTRNQREQNQI